MSNKDTETIFRLFQEGLAELGISLPESAVDNLILYTQNLIKWNRKVNLIAKNTPVPDIVEKHFLDSLTLLPAIEPRVEQQGHLLDVGSGAGFPGLVIKTTCPEKPVTLLEPRQRRVTFLNHIVRTLQLTGIKVCSKRTDQLASSSHPNFALITGRAVADVSTFLDMIHGLTEPGTLVACMQGSSGLQQWEAERGNEKYKRVSIEQTCLPFSRDKRCILLFRRK